MRSIVATGLALVLACGLPAAGAHAAAVETAEVEPIRQDLAATVDAGTAVFIDNPHGNVYLRFGGYEHAVDIHSTLQQPAGAPPLTLERGMADGRYVIASKLAAPSLAPGQRIDLVVYVAQGHAVSVRTGEGGIEARGLKSDLELSSARGDIRVRGNEGTVQARTGEDGEIELALAGTARPGAKQHLSTQTGNITVGVTDALDAVLNMATSAVFATDYSLDVTHRDGAEPDKWAKAVIGRPRSEITLESRRGEIRVLRRAVYLEVGERPPQ
jgi:hypothetical protein